MEKTEVEVKGFNMTIENQLIGALIKKFSKENKTDVVELQINEITNVKGVMI